MSDQRNIHTFPTLQHPRRYIWDFWYYFDPQTALFHVFFLNADPELVPAGQQHDAAVVGYGQTQDFLSMEWGPPDVLAADPKRWDNTSIWTGDIIRIRDGFLLFYTSRNRETDDGHTQNIGAAYADRIDARRWEPLPKIRIQPEQLYYTTRHLPGDVTIHAWRDPYLFRLEEQIYMLIAAKSRHRPLGCNGAIALLRTSSKNLNLWEPLPPLANPGCFAEMEVPQIYQNKEGGLTAVFSCAAKYDTCTTTEGKGGLLVMSGADLVGIEQGEPNSLLPYSSGLYACRVIPELNGEIVGFDMYSGGLRRSGLKIHLQHVDRNFSDCTLK
jgi:beta-fructofuranosidase